MIASVIYAYPKIDAQLNFELFADHAFQFIQNGSINDWNRLSNMFSYISNFSTEKLLVETESFQKMVFDNKIPAAVRSDLGCPTGKLFDHYFVFDRNFGSMCAEKFVRRKTKNMISR